jgi:hypothetical protein
MRSASIRTCPIIVLARVEHIIAVFTADGTSGTPSLSKFSDQYTYPSIGVTTFNENNPNASVRKPIPATITTQS